MWGVPGDVVRLTNGVLYINRVKQIEPYAKHFLPLSKLVAEEGPQTFKINFGPVTVEPGHYFMLGDNRDNSFDSRYWGALDEKLIQGKAEVLYWRGRDHWFFFKEVQ